MREIRFSLGPHPSDPAKAAGCSERGRGGNAWAGAPASDALAPYLTLRAVVMGPVDPKTGYLCNIRAIDSLLRERAVDRISEAADDPRRRSRVGAEVSALWDAVHPHTPPPAQLECLSLWLTPHLAFSVCRGDPSMVSMTYAFEFSAAHRLWCAAFSDEENLRVFGRCTNPNGHGHNYIVRVTVFGAPSSETGTVVDLGAFERIVNEAVIDRFDHKHLNEDCPEFASLNPSVENITRVIYDKLKDAFAPAALARVRVYETAKTYAEYSGA